MNVSRLIPGTILIWAENNGVISAVQLDLEQLCELLSALDRTEISELTLKSDDFELTLRKENRSGAAISSDAAFVSPGVGVSTMDAGFAAASAGPPSVIPSGNTMDATAGTGAVSHPAPAPLSPPVPPPAESKLVEVISPMVGTFYRAPAPDELPFVALNDRIRANQTVCIIEAMKLMNEIEAEVSGQVVEILVQNGEPVEYGQPLMRIAPD